MTKLMAIMAVAVVIGCAGSASAQVLSQDDARKALEGKTFKTHDFGEDGTLMWGTDGKLYAKLATKSDVAAVRWANGGYCSTWTKFRSTEACFTVKKVSDTQYQLYTADGKEDDLLTLQ
jgi:hypothetical protein